MKAPTGLPLLSSIPVLRNLFGNTKNTNNRTELIVLITPRVITNADEARQVTQEYARQFQSLQPLPVKTAVPPATPSPVPAGRRNTVSRSRDRTTARGSAA